MIIYRMVIVEGRCTKLQLLISYIYNHWMTQKYSEFWLVKYNGLVWSNIAVPFFYHPIYMIIGQARLPQYKFYWRASMEYTRWRQTRPCSQLLVDPTFSLTFEDFSAIIILSYFYVEDIQNLVTFLTFSSSHFHS